MKHLGIDYGTKRVGVATSDDGGTVAFPKIVLPTQQAADFVALLVEKEKVDVMVVGESVGNDGKENDVMQSARAWAAGVHARTGVRVEWEWEGYTSGMARSMRRPNGAARGEVARRVAKEKDVVDANAAAIILQSYLDKQRTVA
jgi:putative holliday junction resolvase